MGDVDTALALETNLDLNSQTLNYAGNRYRFDFADWDRAWAHKTQKAIRNGADPPVPVLNWSIKGSPVVDQNLKGKLDSLYWNAIAYEGLRSQAEEILTKYR